MTKIDDHKSIYPRRTSRGHVAVDGVQFVSWQIGINRYALISGDGRLLVRCNSGRSTYTASIDGNTIGRRFIGGRTACAAAVKAMRKEKALRTDDMTHCDREPRQTLTDGTPIYPEHRNILESGERAGQQQDYVVLAEEERAKGFVRPVRRSYRHLKCGTVTTMGRTLAETYARDPHFYSGTFCCGCGTHFPVGADGEFVWDGTNEKVGT